MRLVRTAIRIGIAALAAAVVAVSGGSLVAQASGPSTQDAGEVMALGGGLSRENF